MITAISGRAIEPPSRERSTIVSVDGRPSISRSRPPSSSNTTIRSSYSSILVTDAAASWAMIWAWRKLS